MDWSDRIEVDPKILAGKPIIKGTRLAVEFVLELLSQGWTEAQIIENYDGVVHDDILACLHYAAEVLKSEKIFPLPA